MNILFLTLLDFSSIEEQGIYTDLMREFTARGHFVYIVSPSERKHKQQTRLLKYNRCNILKLKIGNIQKTNIFEKGISFVTLENKFVNGIKKFFSDVKFDLVIYSTPPITLLKAVEYVVQRDNAKTYLLLKDIFPQNAVDLGILSNFGLKGLIYKYFRLKEKKLYNISNYIGCMSEANLDFILRNNPQISRDTVEVCPNSIEPRIFQKNHDERIKIRNLYKVPIDSTAFIYGGNLGKPQGIDFLAECLKANKCNEDVFFVIAGSGTEYLKLKNFIDNEKIMNVSLLGQIPSYEYEKLVNVCDVGMIFLDKQFTIPNFPSRLLSYMLAAIPVLAATDQNTDLGKIIVGNEFGFWCESNDVVQFNQILSKFQDKELREQMGKRARQYLEQNYTVKNSYEIIMKHFILEA